MNAPPSVTVGLLGFAVAPARARPTPNILPSNDLNRPTDIAFMCLGAFGTPGTDPTAARRDGSVHVSGRPMKACHRPPIDGNGGAARSARGVDAQPHVRVRSQQRQRRSVGDRRRHAGSSSTWTSRRAATGAFRSARCPSRSRRPRDGCRLVTANRGSCDLTLVDPSTLLASTFAAQYNSDDRRHHRPVRERPAAHHAPPWRRTSLQAAPYEAVFLPRDTAGLEGSATTSVRPTAPRRPSPGARS